MGLVEMASSASAWYGYEYYKENNVCSFDLKETELIGSVSGSQKEPYSVRIDLVHPRFSTCNCPFAAGNRKVCKHKIALFFTAFPKEADKYLAEVEQAEEDAIKYEEELENQVKKAIATMKKSELQEALTQVLFNSPDWVFNLFLREYVYFEDM